MHAIAHGGVHSLHWKLTLGEKSLAAPGNRNCVGSVPVRCSTNWATSPPQIDKYNFACLFFLIRFIATRHDLCWKVRWGAMLFCFCYMLAYRTYIQTELSLYLWHKPTPFYSVLVSISVFNGSFNCISSINSHDNSPLSYSVLLILFLPYWSFQLYILYESQLTNQLMNCRP